MTTDPQTVAWLDQEDARLSQVIRAHRFAVQYVGAGDEPDEPPFGYTVGLFGLGHPELVLVGLGPESTHAILGRAADAVSDGRDLVAGELLTWPDWVDLRLVMEELPNPGGGARGQPLLRAPGRVLGAGLPAHLGAPRPLLPVGRGRAGGAARPAATRHMARLNPIGGGIAVEPAAGGR